MHERHSDSQCSPRYNLLESVKDTDRDMSCTLSAAWDKPFDTEEEADDKPFDTEDEADDKPFDKEEEADDKPFDIEEEADFTPSTTWVGRLIT